MSVWWKVWCAVVVLEVTHYKHCAAVLSTATRTRVGFGFHSGQAGLGVAWSCPALAPSCRRLLSALTYLPDSVNVAPSVITMTVAGYMS